MERSVFSDFVFVNAMRLKRLISPQCALVVLRCDCFEARSTVFRLYHFWRNNIIDEILLHPHLCIYLDVPAEQCLENIRRRGRVSFCLHSQDLMLWTAGGGGVVGDS